MADTGAPFNLPYPLSTDLVIDGASDIQDLAEQVEEYLLFTESRTVTANATLAIGDTGRVVRFNSSAARTCTVPANATVAFPIGTIVGIYNSGSGTVTVAGAAGVTVRNAGPISQFFEVSLRKRATNEWVLV
jgi:hypothetical protein